MNGRRSGDDAAAAAAVLGRRGWLAGTVLGFRIGHQAAGDISIDVDQNLELARLGSGQRVDGVLVDEDAEVEDVLLDLVG